MGLLALAGAISGAGQAAEKGLQTAQAGMVQESLQAERDKMETRRLELMEQYAGAREQRGYRHTEALQTGQQTFLAGQQKEHQAFLEKTAGTEYARKKETETRNIEQAAELRKTVEQELVSYTKQKGQDPDYLKALHAINQATQSDLEKANTKLAQFKLLHAAEDRLHEIRKADAVTAALIFKDATNEINHLSSQVTKAELNGDQAEATRLREQIKRAEVDQRAARAKAIELIGIQVEQPAPKKPFVNPEAMPKAQPSSGPSIPAPVNPAAATPPDQRTRQAAALQAYHNAVATGDPQMIDMAKLELQKAGLGMTELPGVRQQGQITIVPQTPR